MRRILASLLVALFSFSLIAPAVFASDADSKLPACCRRDGKHHCTVMAGRLEKPSGPAAGTGRCESFPGAAAVPANQIAGLTGISQGVFTGFLSQPASISRTELLSRMSYSLAGQKRGPPALHS